MSEFKETTRSYLQRIMPDIHDLDRDVNRYVQAHSRLDPNSMWNTKKFLLMEVWASYRKIEEAFRQIEDLHDNS